MKNESTTKVDLVSNFFDDNPKKGLRASTVTSIEEVGSDSKLSIEEVISLNGLAPDVIIAKAPWKELRISQVIEWLEYGFDRDEIAVMVGHPRSSIDILCKRYKALHNRRCKSSKRLPFAVIEDVEEDQ